MADEEVEYFDEDQEEEEEDDEEDEMMEEDADADDDDDDEELDQDGSDEEAPDQEEEEEDDEQASDEDSDREGELTILPHRSVVCLPVNGTILDGARLEPGQTRAKSTAQSRYEKACSERLNDWLNGYHTLPSSSTQKPYSLDDYRNALSYTAEPLAACPTAGSHVHCMALSADGSVLLSGGSDGHVRRYDIYNTINGRNLLTAAVRHQFAEGFNKGGFLSAIYANEEEEPSGSAAAVVPANPKELAKKPTTTGAGGPAGSKKSKGKKKAEEDEEEEEEENGAGVRLPIAPVHALACHSDALWALAGSESGAINLMTLRHTLTSNRPSANGTGADGDHTTGKSGPPRRRNGYIQHVLRKHKGPVSALQLTSDQMGFVSGGWDRNVFQWDLNTGGIVREYSGHVGQISSLSFRPTRPGTRLSPSRSGSVISIHASAAGTAPTDAMDETGTQPADEFSSPTKSTTARSRASATPVAVDKQRARSGSLASAKSRRSRSRSAVDLPAATENISFDLPAGIKTEDRDGDSAAMLADKDADGDRLMSDAQASAQTPSKSGAAEMAMDSMMEEDLALERELNESLGIGLSGTGHGRNDEDDEMSVMGLASKQRQQQREAVDAARKPSLSSSTNNRKKPGDQAASDGDSLFGDSSDATDADADGDVDADADADADADEEDEDTSPLVHRHLAQNGKPELDADAPGEIDPDADADADGEIDADGEADDAEDDEEPLFLASRKHAASHAKLANGKASAPNGKLSSFSKPTLQKSSLASLSGGSGFDADTATFSPDVLLTTTLGGQVMLWDRRVMSDSKGGVHAIPLSEKTPPWCATATWSTYGDRIYVGRRNEVIEEWDLRAISSNNRGSEDGSIIWNGMSKPKMTRTLQLPVGCGPITSVISMPNDRHIVCGSQDNVRIWDTSFVTEGSKLPFKIVAGHNGAMVSSLCECFCPFATERS